MRRKQQTKIIPSPPPANEESNNEENNNEENDINMDSQHDNSESNLENNSNNNAQNQDTNEPNVQTNSSHSTTPPHPFPLIQHQTQNQPNLETTQTIFAAFSEMAKYITMPIRNSQALTSVNHMATQAKFEKFNGNNSKVAFQLLRQLEQSINNFESVKGDPLNSLEFMAISVAHFEGAGLDMVIDFINSEASNITSNKLLDFIRTQLVDPNLEFNLSGELYNFKQMSNFKAYKQSFLKLINKFPQPYSNELEKFIVHQFVEKATPGNRSYLRAHCKTITDIRSINLSEELLKSDSNHFNKQNKKRFRSSNDNSDTTTSTGQSSTKSSSSASLTDGSPPAKKKRVFCKKHNSWGYHTTSECRIGSSSSSKSAPRSKSKTVDKDTTEENSKK
ncbi:uncharacterized protein J8A68_002501 [[Candida] subhashii]|uniref:Uncharacterized protein n=1 Tax=[Candida] subhashii TaxID=561895 RepID=A0A8J5QXD9_9ASCO|nr:uncharacterized protein J8A68_002501 [[Candida] subhashii]KAG7664000.1 hypothetical protein J8A68_002501 [[Candida] subhashii]